MKSRKEITIATIITVLLVLVTAFCISGTVLSQKKGGSIVEGQYYRAAEQEYVRAVKSLLSEKGYENSGVTMNSVVEEDGSRAYTVTIHHRRIEQLDAEEKHALIEACQRLVFPIGDCIFFHQFLETDR